jgi:putative sigma-54 modulation protein
MTVTIRGTDLDLTPALKAYATKKVMALIKFMPSLNIARVELQRTTRHHRKGEVWRAEVSLHAPQHLFRAEALAADIYSAIDAVKDEVKRELRVVSDKKSSRVRQARREKASRR